MTERLLYSEDLPLPLFVPGEIVCTTPNFEVKTDYQTGMETTTEGERIIIEPVTIRGRDMLTSACVFHNIYTFDFRRIRTDSGAKFDIFPCISIAYSSEHLARILDGIVVVPRPGESTNPSLRRMETLIEKRALGYSFADMLPRHYRVPNFFTRHIRMMQATHKDEIPNKKISSISPDRYYKVRKTFWTGILADLVYGKHSGEYNQSSIDIEIDAFLKKFHNPEFTSSRHITTAEDIAEANQFINLLWQYHGNK